MTKNISKVEKKKEKTEVNATRKVHFAGIYEYRTIPTRDAGGGGAGGARAIQKFGILVNPIWTKGGRLCPPYYYWPPHLFGRCGASEVAFKDCFSY